MFFFFYAPTSPLFTHTFTILKMNIFVLDGNYVDDKFVTRLMKKLEKVDKDEGIGIHIINMYMIRCSTEVVKRIFDVCKLRLVEIAFDQPRIWMLEMFVEMMSLCPLLRRVRVYDSLESHVGLTKLIRQLQHTNVTDFRWCTLGTTIESYAPVVRALNDVAPRLKLTWLYCETYNVYGEFCSTLFRACAQMPKLRKLDVTSRWPMDWETARVLMSCLGDLYRLEAFRYRFEHGVDDVGLHRQLNYEIKRYIRPSVPSLIALCHAHRYGKVENGKKTCAARRLPVDLLRMLVPMLGPTNASDVELPRAERW